MHVQQRMLDEVYRDMTRSRRLNGRRSSQDARTLRARPLLQLAPLRPVLTAQEFVDDRDRTVPLVTTPRLKNDAFNEFMRTLRDQLAD